jgi:hypothetical protein
VKIDNARVDKTQLKRIVFRLIMLLCVAPESKKYCNIRGKLSCGIMGMCACWWMKSDRRRIDGQVKKRNAQCQTKPVSHFPFNDYFYFGKHKRLTARRIK